ncbi:SH3 domain-containing protein [Methylobacterium sp. J-088]|uniref:SH3 domain-containing protein n=1 Tax=Methylobacterium sp. J-088 TaxID=2836664 RepID=UPI001FB8E260|nr:SH3 domain-containing protein [Methylobacterium sp. J-088]MCJ2066513.1 SH3 domain-containing protein [Methylobacterium sp. J-088]
MWISERWPRFSLLALTCTLASGPARATAYGPDRFAVRDVRADDTLALRAQPNASARKITALPPNTRGLENLGCVDGKTGQQPSDTGPARDQLWCKIRIGSFVGWASARFLREETKVLKPYSASGAPTGPKDFKATSTAIETQAAGEGRWKVMTQSVVSGSTTADVPNEVTVSAQLVDCRLGSSEVIRLTGDPSGYSTPIEEKPGTRFEPPLSDKDEHNLWWFVCRDASQRYR